jgi:hypothetical protein
VLVEIRVGISEVTQQAETEEEDLLEVQELLGWAPEQMEVQDRLLDQLGQLEQTEEVRDPNRMDLLRLLLHLHLQYLLFPRTRRHSH